MPDRWSQCEIGDGRCFAFRAHSVEQARFVAVAFYFFFTSASFAFLSAFSLAFFPIARSAERCAPPPAVAIMAVSTTPLCSPEESAFLALCP